MRKLFRKERNINKIKFYLIICILIIGIVFISGCISKEKTNSDTESNSPNADQFNRNVVYTTTEIDENEKPEYIRMFDDFAKLNIAPPKLSSNMKFTEVKDRPTIFQKIFNPIESEGLWYINPTEYSPTLQVFAVIKQENMEYFFLEGKDVRLENIHMVKAPETERLDLIMDFTYESREDLPKINSNAVKLPSQYEIRGSSSSIDVENGEYILRLNLIKEDFDYIILEILYPLVLEKI